MGTVSFHTKEIQLKIVYCGPGLGGKTTSLQRIHEAIPADRRPEMVSLPTQQDRTLFFDFVPTTVTRVGDFDVRVQLYTVPGQVFYRGTREVVLRGADGLVFVADSQTAARDANLVSLDDLTDLLVQQQISITRMPLVLQYNKRDLPQVMPLEQLDRDLNYLEVPRFPTVALTGQGVDEALKEITSLTLRDFVKKNRLT